MSATPTSRNKRKEDILAYAIQHLEHARSALGVDFTGESREWQNGYNATCSALYALRATLKERVGE